jgi:hypothetical protein
MTRSYHGDYLVENDLPAVFDTLRDVDDGDRGPSGRRVRVSTATLEATDRIALLSLSGTDLGPAPAADPLALLATAEERMVPSGPVWCRQVVEVDDVPATRAKATGPNSQELWRLLEVSWGAPSIWQPRNDRGGTLGVDPLSVLLVLTTGARANVPDLRAARAFLATTDHLPGGRRGQTLRERGSTWPSVPQVADWSEPLADRWVVTGLLDALLDESPEDPEPGIRITELAPGGPPIALIQPSRGVIDHILGASVLTLWEGLDQDGAVVAISAVKSGFVADRRRELPIWAIPHTRAEPNLWAGETVTVTHQGEESDGVGTETWTERYQLGLAELGRQSFPSRRIVTADPCTAADASALDLALANPGPFPIYAVHLEEEFEGRFFGGEDKGILVRLDGTSAPVRWVAAQDGSGGCGGSIDSGELSLFDQDAAAWVEEQRLSVHFRRSAPIALVRSRPNSPADVCVVRGLGGDGPFWSALGLAADGTPVAVFTGNFDLLELLP